MNRTPIIEAIMAEFAGRTGLGTTAESPQRYLWTDAFAVCNYLELYCRTGEKRYLETALELVGQVHWILGRHRDADSRRGWISGLSEEEGTQHPTRGGLRIGKKLPERRRDDHFDERLEWEQDGQYFHYLTKWMHALDRVARVSGDSAYSRWALELAKAAHAAFSYLPSAGGRKRMYWKMSIDFSYPHVPSMGHHDPLDGLITYQQVQATAVELGARASGLDLDTEIAEMASMCEGVSWQTADALGIGSLLVDACRLAQLIAHSKLSDSERLAFLLDEAEISLSEVAQMGQLSDSAEYRLAFRELGLSIGLHGIEFIQELIARQPGKFPNCQRIAKVLSGLARFLPLQWMIEDFWLTPENQQCKSWNAHQDINSVMLATSLEPNGFLFLFGKPLSGGEFPL